MYALACVLYECLTAQLPYPVDSMEEQVAAHLTKDPPKPSVFDPAIPVGFDDVIARGMAKDPEQRYQSAHELAAAARRALSGAPTPAHAGQHLRRRWSTARATRSSPGANGQTRSHPRLPNLLSSSR